MNIYFNGTANNNVVPNENQQGKITIPAILLKMSIQDENNISQAIEGCGMNNPDYRDCRKIFSFNLVKQVEQVAKEINQKIKSRNINLNIYGYSRGGIGAFLLCKKLKLISPEKLTINVVVIDPVPGNFISTVQADFWFGGYTTLTAGVSDLSDCHNVQTMLLLYMNEPKPHIISILEDQNAFAPLLPSYSKNTKADVDVMRGLHGHAVRFNSSYGVVNGNSESILVLHRVIEFLKNSGAKFDFKKIHFENELYQLIINPTPEKLKQRYEIQNLLMRKETPYRDMHLSYRLFSRSGKKYLNKYHQTLDHSHDSLDEISLLVGMNPKTNTRLNKIIILIAMFILFYKVVSSALNNNKRHEEMRPHYLC